MCQYRYGHTGACLPSDWFRVSPVSSHPRAQEPAEIWIPGTKARDDPKCCDALSRSISCAVLRESRLEFGVDGVRIAAGLLHVLGPHRLQRFGSLPPLGELLRRNRIDLAGRIGLELLDAGALE